MDPILEYPPVTDELLAEVVRRVLSAGSPLKVVLFGARQAATRSLTVT
jgi:hypothetical protein